MYYWNGDEYNPGWKKRFPMQVDRFGVPIPLYKEQIEDRNRVYGHIPEDAKNAGDDPVNVGGPRSKVLTNPGPMNNPFGTSDGQKWEDAPLIIHNYTPKGDVSDTTHTSDEKAAKERDPTIMLPSTDSERAQVIKEDGYRHEGDLAYGKFNSVGGASDQKPEELYKVYAGLSKNVYKLEDISSTNDSGYDIDYDLSDGDRVVYMKNNKVVIAFRGTNPTNLTDLGTDVVLALGLQALTKRFEKSVEMTNKAISKYGFENVSLTGHSLGGAQALFVGYFTHLKTVAFNPGAFVVQSLVGATSNAIDGITGKDTGDNLHIFTSGADPLSVFSHLQNAHHYQFKAKSLWAQHAIDNFT